jgi:hypothetical protein
MILFIKRMDSLKIYSTFNINLMYSSVITNNYDKIAIKELKEKV